MIFFFFCVEPSVFNHLFLSNRDTSVLAKQLVLCLLVLDELSYSQLLVACFYPFCALLVAGLSIAKVLGNQAVKPKFLSSPSRLVSDAEASLVYVVNFRTACFRGGVGAGRHTKLYESQNWKVKNIVVTMQTCFFLKKKL